MVSEKLCHLLQKGILEHLNLPIKPSNHYLHVPLCQTIICVAHNSYRIPLCRNNKLHLLAELLYSFKAT